MADAPKGWAFLVAAGRRTGYRTVLAPDVLVERGLAGALVAQVGGGGDPARPRTIELHGTRDLGRLTATAVAEPLTAGDLEGGSGGEVVSDEHGRPLQLLYGIVAGSRLRDTVPTSDLLRARSEALRSYRRFLDDEDGFGVDASASFALAMRAPPPPPSILGAIAAALVLLVAVPTVAVLSSGEEPLTIYSSLPLQGADRALATDVDRGMRLAFEQARAASGSPALRYRRLDASTGAKDAFSPASVRADARRAAADEGAVAYVGDLDSAASALSIPILAEARVAQVSPTNTAVGLTASGLGAAAGEPARYYAGGVRNYARIVPHDRHQGTALATLVRVDRCTRVAIVGARDREGAGLAQVLRARVPRPGTAIVFDKRVPESTSRASALARLAARRRADCVMFTGGPQDATLASLAAVGGALPRARLYASRRLAATRLTDRGRSGVRATVAARVSLTLPASAALRSATARRFAVAFRHRYRAAPGPFAIYGYEAMRLAINAIRRAEGTRREDVIAALRATKDRRSVLGRYSIDGNGDTTSTTFARFAIRDGRLRFVATIDSRR